VIAGEASGDAIGAKVIHALARKQAQGDPRAQALEFRGVGGYIHAVCSVALHLYKMSLWIRIVCVLQASDVLGRWVRVAVPDA
jgi:lipid A disaccharide synthetase